MWIWQGWEKKADGDRLLLLVTLIREQQPLLTRMPISSRWDRHR